MLFFLEGEVSMNINTKYTYNNNIRNSITLEKNNEQDAFTKELQKKLASIKTDVKDSYIKEKVSEYWDNLSYGNYNKNVNKYLDNQKKLINEEEENEIKQEEEAESETKSDIIVKPDGSRVLVMTLQIGGMESTVSVQISEPTDMPNKDANLEQKNNLGEDQEIVEDINIPEMTDYVI